MCSPGLDRPGRGGVSHLRAFWLYQLHHGNQLRICFPCFKLLFLRFQEALESGDWAEEDGEPEQVQQPWAGPEEEGEEEEEEGEEEEEEKEGEEEEEEEEEPSLGRGPSGWQGEGQPEPDGLGDWGSHALGSDPGESAELGLMPTEPTPQNAAPQGLGPEDAAWAQGFLPWRFGGVPTCSHWPSPSVSLQPSLPEALPPGEAMLLELVASPGLDPAEAHTWLLSLQAMAMVGGPAGTYLRHVSPRWVRRCPGQGWAVLLEPDGPWGLRLQSPAPGQDLSPWRLSLLESSPAGQGAQLVPAGTALLLRGFRVLSYAPWNEEGDRAAGAEAWPPAQGPGFGIAGTGSWGAGESLGPGGAPVFPAAQPEAQVTSGLLQATAGWGGQAAAPAPQPGELLAREGGWGLWWERGPWPRD